MPDDTKAGAEMDRLVAEKVMGWKPTTDASRYLPCCINAWGQPILSVDEVGHNVSYWNEEVVFQPSTRIDHAWVVIERITDPANSLINPTTGFPASTHFSHWFDRAHLWANDSRLAAEAIVRAALKAAGGGA